MDAYQRLVHYAEISAESELSRAPLSIYNLSDATVHRRNKAVNWINVVSLQLGFFIISHPILYIPPPRTNLININSLQSINSKMTITDHFFDGM